MKKTLFSKLGSLFLLASILLSACATATTSTSVSNPLATNPAGESQPTSSTGSNASKPLFIYVTPNPIGVNEFLKLGQTGLEAAGKKYNADTKVLESEDPTSREENIRAAVNDGATVVVVLGFEFNDIIAKLAPQSPDTQFLIVDQCIDNPPANVHCATFREYEAAYLIGVEAAMLSKSGVVGAIGASDIPFLHRYTDGFAEGAKSINSDIQVDIRWVGGDNPFSDPVRAKEQALAMANNKVDQVLAATAGGNFGVFEAAKANNFFSYGVDVNQCPSAPGYVVDNLLKHADVALEKSIDSIMNNAGPQTVVYGLKEGGIGVEATLPESELSSSQCVIADHPDVIQKVKDVQGQIINGSITLQDPMFQK
jgi:basic membrane protein A and related proteins